MILALIFLSFSTCSIEMNGSSIEGKSGWLGEVGWSFFGVLIALLLKVGCLIVLFSMLSGLCHVSFFGGGDSSGVHFLGV